MSLKLREVWENRQLLYFLVWRDIKVRYKQTFLGAAWAVVQPVTTMVIFTVVFSRLAKIPSDGLPYPIFAFTGLLPWNYFASALARATGSIVSDTQLVSKIYFPRLILPLSAVVLGIVDFAVAFVVLLCMMSWFGIGLTWGVLALPLFLLLALASALAVALWLAPINVRFRDVNHVIPFILQCWMYASPVAYPVSLVPEKWRFLYSLNPMAGVIEGFRWALLGQARPNFDVIGVSTIMIVLPLLGGLMFFKRMEKRFADLL